MATEGTETKPAARTDELESLRAQSERLSKDGGKIKYEDGFSFRVVIGAFFVCLIMMPGSIYLGLVAGQSLGGGVVGGSSQWVTIVLFSEIARRSFISLRRQEIYCIYYMAGVLTVTGRFKKFVHESFVGLRRRVANECGDIRR